MTTELRIHKQIQHHIIWEGREYSNDYRTSYTQVDTTPRCLGGVGSIEMTIEGCITEFRIMNTCIYFWQLMKMFTQNIIIST